MNTKKTAQQILKQASWNPQTLNKLKAMDNKKGTITIEGKGRTGILKGTLHIKSQNISVSGAGLDYLISNSIVKDLDLSASGNGVILHIKDGSTAYVETN